MQKIESDAVRYPPTHQPSPPTIAQKLRRSSQALRRFLAVGRKPTLLRVALVLGEAPRRPVGLRRVAPARAMERGDVLQGDQDVAVELDVSNLVDGAVGGQDALVVVAAEQRNLDLLALVLARVVLHRPERTRCAAPSRGG